MTATLDSECVERLLHDGPDPEVPAAVRQASGMQPEDVTALLDELRLHLTLGEAACRMVGAQESAWILATAGMMVEAAGRRVK